MAVHKGKRIQVKGQVERVRTVKVAHDIGGEDRLSFVLFPVGFRYNRELAELRKGDIMVFLDKSEHYVRGVCRLSLRSALAEHLCWLRYGFGIERAITLWRERLLLGKQDVKVMSNDECLIVFYEKEEVRYE